MHQALFIDEIVRDIFGFSVVGGHAGDLCQLVRCCKAWKDPALDRIWGRLSSAAPLIRLIPGVLEAGGIFVSPSSQYVYVGVGVDHS